MKILFYIENNWVFGKIHNELIKALHPDVYCDIMRWDNTYTERTFQNILLKYDYILTTINVCFPLNQHYGIPLNKMIGVAHGNHDIIHAIDKNDQFNELAGYVVISPILQHISIAHGIHRIPDVLRVGMFQNNYPKNVADKPTCIGCFSAYSRDERGVDIKRGNLIDKISFETNIDINRCVDVHFLQIESLYNNINLVLCPSLTEGNPYTVLEAFCCGIPVIQTPVGISNDYINKHGGGVILPFQPDAFVSNAIIEIDKMRSDQSYYKKLCYESFEIGMMIDWKYIRDEWINYFNYLPH